MIKRLYSYNYMLYICSRSASAKFLQLHNLQLQNVHVVLYTTIVIPPRDSHLLHLDFHCAGQLQCWVHVTAFEPFFTSKFAASRGRLHHTPQPSPGSLLSTQHTIHNTRHTTQNTTSQSPNPTKVPTDIARQQTARALQAL